MIYIYNIYVDYNDGQTELFEEADGYKVSNVNNMLIVYVNNNRKAFVNFSNINSVKIEEV